MASVYHGVAIMLVVWAVAFGLLARNAPAPATAQRKGLGVMIEVLTREKLSWLLSAFYFLTFGGFVAFSIYLPTLLKDEFHLRAGRCRFSDCRVRGSGDPASPTWRVALGSHRRRTRVVRCFSRRRSFRAADGVVVDDSLYRRRSRLRGIVGLREWRCVQAGAAVFPDSDRHGHRPGRRHGRARRLLPTAAAGVLPQPYRRHLAGLRTAGHRRLGIVVGQPQGLRPAAASARHRATGRSAPDRRPCPGGRMGHAVDRAAGSCNRGRIPESAELRPGPGDLHFCRGLRDMGRGLSLQRLAGEAADASVLGSRLGTLPAWGRRPQPVSCERAGGHSSGRTTFHRPSIPPALVDAPVPLLGMHAGGGHHLSRWSSAGFTSARFPATN